MPDDAGAFAPFLDSSFVADGVEQLSLRTPTLPPATHTNAFIVGSGEALLVEPASPYADEIDRVAAWVAERERQGLKLRAILLTHHHADHVGGASALRDRLGLPLWAHAATAQRLEGRAGFDRLLEHGERIELEGKTSITLEAVHTPGHAPGHLCFLLREPNVLIAGDMVAGIGTILIEATDGDMQLYLRSLEAMDALETRMLLPAHGDPITEPRERLRFYIQHRLKREGKVQAALAQASGFVSIEELVPVAYADTPPVAWPLARLAAEAHLIKLVREGKAEEQAGRYRAVPGA